jgi:hypothetical protein
VENAMTSRIPALVIPPGTTLGEALDMVDPEWRSYVTILDPDPPPWTEEAREPADESPDPEEP